jgi:hypothetical protein
VYIFSFRFQLDGKSKGNPRETSTSLNLVFSQRSTPHRDQPESAVSKSTTVCLCGTRSAGRGGGDDGTYGPPRFLVADAGAGHRAEHPAAGRRRRRCLLLNGGGGERRRRRQQ